MKFLAMIGVVINYVGVLLFGGMEEENVGVVCYMGEITTVNFDF